MSYDSYSDSSQPLLRKSVKKLFNFQALTLENKGSVARDHMANERTFLAWLRTSLSLVTIGIGVAQLFKLHNDEKSIQHQTKFAKPIGASIIAIGIMTLVLGFLRYFRVQELLLQEKFPVSRYSVTVIVTAVGLLIISVLIALYV